jgi:hypothetical protein
MNQEKSASLKQGRNKVLELLKNIPFISRKWESYPSVGRYQEALKF